MPGNALAEEMLSTALSDAKALGNIWDSECFDDRTFGFHAQQAIEKALKAWLLPLGRAHPFTHDLGYLVHELQKSGIAVDEYWKFLDLTNYAVRFRYEAIPIDGEPLDRRELLGDIQSLIARVANLIAPA